MNSIISHNNAGLSANRQPVDSVKLQQLVDAELTSACALGDTFTAYDITKRLRAAHPTLEIIHAPGVREAVHTQMFTAITNGLAYTYDNVVIGKHRPVQYFPVTPAVTVARQPTHALPAPIDWEDSL